MANSTGHSARELIGNDADVSTVSSSSSSYRSAGSLVGSCLRMRSAGNAGRRESKGSGGRTSDSAGEFATLPYDHGDAIHRPRNRDSRDVRSRRGSHF